MKQDGYSKFQHIRHLISYRAWKAEIRLYLFSIGLVVLTSAISVPIHYYIEPVNLVMLYLAAVVVAAVFLGRGPAMLASFLSVMTFDFFLVEPRLSFTVADSQYLLTFFGLLLVGLVISGSAATLRDQVNQLRRRQVDLAALNSLSQDLARAVRLEDMLASLLEHIEQVFVCPAVILLPDANAALYMAASSPGLTLRQQDLMTAQQVFLRANTPALGEGQQTPDAMVFHPLETPQGVVGVIGLQMGDEQGFFFAERLQLVGGFANLAGLALERARLAEKANQAQVLENSERLQAALLNSISHELRTPLVSITGALSTLADESVSGWSDLQIPSAWRELVDTAYGEAQRLNLLVGNLLDMTRLESGVFRLSREPCDVQDLVGIALSRYAERRSARVVNVTIAENLPLAEVDVTLMVQVLLNLLDNAAKYSPESTPIDLECRLVGDAVAISIADQGIGILPGDLEKVFGKFYRPAGAQGIQGIGLGLSISKGIVDAHGGRIWAENRPGAGTVITLALPIEQRFKEDKVING